MIYLNLTKAKKKVSCFLGVTSLALILAQPVLGTEITVQKIDKQYMGLLEVEEKRFQSEIGKLETKGFTPHTDPWRTEYIKLADEHHGREKKIFDGWEKDMDIWKSMYYSKVPK